MLVTVMKIRVMAVAQASSCVTQNVTWVLDPSKCRYVGTRATKPIRKNLGFGVGLRQRYLHYRRDGQEHPWASLWVKAERQWVGNVLQTCKMTVCRRRALYKLPPEATDWGFGEREGSRPENPRHVDAQSLIDIHNGE
jgi:hypothetical protein